MNLRHIDCFFSSPLGLRDLSLHHHANANNLVDELRLGQLDCVRPLGTAAATNVMRDTHVQECCWSTVFSLLSSPSTQQWRRFSPPLDLDIECEEPQTSSVQRSVDGLAHVGPTSSLRRSLPGSTVAQARRRSVRRFTLGHAPGTGTSMLRSTVRCSTRSCGMVLRDLQETNVSFVCEQPSSLVWSMSHNS